MQLAISRDGYSGGVVRTAVITREGVVRDVITERDFVFLDPPYKDEQAYADSFAYLVTHSLISKDGSLVSTNLSKFF